MKVCTKCKLSKSLKYFPRYRTSPDGHFYYCKLCKSEAAKVHYDKNKEKINKKCQEYHALNAPKIRSQSWARRVKRIYGITLEQYEQKKASQDYRCKLCSRHESELRVGLNLDHCHKTGKLRDFLCNECNVGIGNFKEDTALLLKTIDYLIEHNT